MGVEDKPGEVSPEQKEFKGQKWGYCFKFLDFKTRSQGLFGEKRTMEFGGQKFDSWEEIDKAINKLGEKGWELVSATQQYYGGGPWTDRYTLFFKRPKQ